MKNRINFSLYDYLIYILFCERDHVDHKDEVPHSVGTYLTFGIESQV